MQIDEHVQYTEYDKITNMINMMKYVWYDMRWYDIIR